ncbi:MAG: hypothetical protein Q4F97_12455 [Bacteroidales bacterium]|nr:hypothetical protein [Bacteroidales bacterium]
MFVTGFFQSPPHDTPPLPLAVCFPLSGYIWDLHQLESVRSGQTKKKSLILRFFISLSSDFGWIGMKTDI